MRTAVELRAWVRETLGDRKLVVVSNREPYVHALTPDGGVACRVPAGGLVTALDPVMRACGGTWVAHGSGDADRLVADAEGRVPVPPDAPRYTLRRVWLGAEQQAGYYDGFANGALWPLCHRAFVAPRFERADWDAYRAVNRTFADVVLDEVRDHPGALVLIQDYHFALLPRMLKEARPDLALAQFWHIPWPTREAFEICPWAEEILDGMLGNDLLGFHTQQDCGAFLSTVDRGIEAVVDPAASTVRRGGRRTLVQPFPISVDADAISSAAAEPAVTADAERLRGQLGLHGQLVGVGVDRLDYTKGVPERLRAVDELLTRRPDHRGRFTFLQLGPASRAHLPAYRRLLAEVEALVAGINAKHGTPGWTPVRLLTGDHPQRTLLAYYRLADVCVVSSLHDGMNLVAKEFVSARPDAAGALVLSRFAGAAAELEGALLVNPFDTAGFAETLARALGMPAAERRDRMSRLRAAVADNTVYDWASRLLGALGRLAGPRSGPEPAQPRTVVPLFRPLDPARHALAPAALGALRLAAPAPGVGGRDALDPPLSLPRQRAIL